MFPFRLGSTSYVYPADLVTNARQLGGVVDDMELVLFETETHGSNFPTAAEIVELTRIADASALTYTVHLPADLKFGDVVSADKIRRVIDATRSLNPFAYIAHLDGRIFLNDTSASTIARWQAEAVQALQSLAEWTGDATRICVENVERWNPAYFADVVSEVGTGRCVDIGHLWLEDSDPLPHLKQNLSHTRVIHLHGIGTRDHQSLRHMSDAQLLPVFETLIQENYRGVVTLEVFGEEDFYFSRDVVFQAVEGIANASPA